MTELYCPRCGGHRLRRGKVTVATDIWDQGGRAMQTSIDGCHVVTKLRPSKAIGANGETEGLAIAFSCATCGDGLTLTLAARTGAQFEWSFTSEAEDALAELRVSVEDPP
jgi:hypothetical protein